MYLFMLSNYHLIESLYLMYLLCIFYNMMTSYGICYTVLMFILHVINTS